MCVSTEADVTTAPSIEQSAMASECGRGRGSGHGCGRGYNFIEGRGSFRGGHGSYGGR